MSGDFQDWEPPDPRSKNILDKHLVEKIDRKRAWLSFLWWVIVIGSVVISCYAVLKH